MTEPERSESRRLGVLSSLLHDAVEPPTATELHQGLNALRARVATERARRWPARSAALLLAALGCALVVALVSPRFWRSSAPPGAVAIRRVDGGKILEGGYLVETGGAGVRLHFDEGSQFVLTPGARGRLRAITAEGTRFALDHGTASFRITPSTERRWWVEAGPFVVSVRGTDFTVGWDPTTDALEVDLRQGRVVVSGPIVGDELVVRPGQRLRVDLLKGEMVVSEGRAETDRAAVPRPAVQGSGSAATDAVPVVAPVAPSAQVPPTPSAGATRRWREALASGQWERILADLEHEGVASSLRTLSSDDLFVVADAARYRRRPDLARAALLAQRERFPQSPRALDAIFLLGRVEEERAGGKRAAIERYDEYLVRAAGGTYAAEALGRKLILVRALEGPDQARRVAEEYLARFPSGSYAEAARALRRAP